MINNIKHTFTISLYLNHTLDDVRFRQALEVIKKKAPHNQDKHNTCTFYI